MAHTDWMIRGTEVVSCNCSYGCPCQFNALPTNGDCRAAIGVEIEKGHHGKVKLDGLRIAATIAWPGPIHMGKGEVQPIVDERATPEQREALLKIMSGQDTEPGATFFQVFISMCEKVHPPMFKKIEYSSDLENCVGRVNVPGVVEIKTEPIKNPVTGHTHHAKVSLRSGFEYMDAEYCSGSINAKTPIKLDSVGTHAHLAKLHMTGQGLVR